MDYFEKKQLIRIAICAVLVLFGGRIALELVVRPAEPNLRRPRGAKRRRGAGSAGSAGKREE